MSQDMTYNHLFCRFLRVSIISLSVSTICNTSSFVLCSVHDTFIIRLHIHISNASNRQISSFCKVNVSLPYNTTLQTNTFTIRFRRFLHEIPILIESFFSQCNILILTSRQLLPSLCNLSKLFLLRWLLFDCLNNEEEKSLHQVYSIMLITLSEKKCCLRSVLTLFLSSWTRLLSHFSINLHEIWQEP